MRTLLKFALKRRFFNKLSLSLQALFILVVFGLLYVDKLSAWIGLDLHQPYQVAFSSDMDRDKIDVDLWANQGFELVKDKADILIELNEEGYAVKGVNDVILKQRIQAILLIQHKQNILKTSQENVHAWLEEYENIQVHFEEIEVEQTSFKAQLALVFLTGLYFMLLNFIAVNSGEIIMEKTTHIMPLILSSVSTRAHFVSKLILGMFSVMFQIVSSILIVGLGLYLRFRDDRFRGLIQAASKYLALPEFEFELLLKLFDFNIQDFQRLSLALLFMLVGIFIVQLLILVLASQVKNAEEAAAIQGPFYLVLLLIYYLSLSIQSPASLSHGLGYQLSFVPVLSMLMMPIRIFTQDLVFVEILSSLTISFALIILLLSVTYPTYVKGLRNIR